MSQVLLNLFNHIALLLPFVFCQEKTDTFHSFELEYYSLESRLVGIRHKLVQTYPQSEVYFGISKIHAEIINTMEKYHKLLHKNDSVYIDAGNTNPLLATNNFRKTMYKPESAKDLVLEPLIHFEKNSKYSYSAYESVKKYKLDQKQAEILTHQKEIVLAKETRMQAKLIILCLSLLIVALVSFFLYRMRKNKILNSLELELLANKKDSKYQKLLNRTLRAQMNPHFIFNTLSSIKYFALFKSKEETGEYITSFSDLIRGILEYNELETISLKDEIDWIKNYISIEQKKYNPTFSFELFIDQNLDENQEWIPPMLIQPFIENAIKHGLHPKKEDRKLFLGYYKTKGGYDIVVEDNGVGMKKQKFPNEKPNTRKSLGLKIVNDRIEQIKTRGNLEIFYRYCETKKIKNDQGTRVIISIKKII